MDLVFIALIPEEPLYSELREKMEHYSKLVDSQKALHLPPHITVVPPFLTKHFDECIEHMRRACKDLRPFTIELEGLQHISHRILYLPVHSDYISKVHEALLEIAAIHQEHRFRKIQHAKTKREKELVAQYGSAHIKEFYKPHFTLAKSDIDREKLRTLLQEQHEHTTIRYPVRQIAVLRHQEGRWHIASLLELQH